MARRDDGSVKSRVDGHRSVYAVARPGLVAVAQGLGERANVFGIAPFGSQCGGGDLEGAAKLGHIAILRVGEVLAERATQVRGGHHECSRTLPAFDHSSVYERLHRFADGVSTGSGQFAQFGFGRDARTHRPLLRDDLLA